MRLSIIIAAHNEGQALVKTVASCVETCAGLDYEILVADDASWDGSVDEVERRFSRVRVLKNLKRLGPSPTKDRGPPDRQSTSSGPQELHAEHL